jgi:DNA-3-methyladenine glycosylase II
MSVLAQRFRGVKPPQFPSLLEALINGIACQQFSLASGIQMLNRVSEKFGTPLLGIGIRAHTFPRPEDLAELKPEPLRNLGFSR